jgi:hypothetical protein
MPLQETTCIPVPLISVECCSEHDCTIPFERTYLRRRLNLHLETMFADAVSNVVYR